MEISTQSDVAGVVLAAGRGSRMQSDLPKVLHSIMGKTMLHWVIEALKGAGLEKLCLVLPQDLSPFLPFIQGHSDLAVCSQPTPNGTAGAVSASAVFFQATKTPSYAEGSQLRQGQPSACRYVLICNGDTPALESQLIESFLNFCFTNKSPLSVLGMDVPNPKGYGRLLLNPQGFLKDIIEEKETDELTRKITVCNTGVIFAEVSFLFSLLSNVQNNNTQKEFYLTDCIRLACAAGKPPLAFVSKEWTSLVGVNDREQLLTAEAILKTHQKN